jgi:chemotaxis protein methyltransferase CheR
MSATPVSRDGQEFTLTDEDFSDIRTLIYDHAGIALTEVKRQLVYSRVSRRLRALGLVRFRDYLEILRAGDAQEWVAFTNALTTNLTSFFREEHHFPILLQYLRRPGGTRPAMVWCCAASTGEEPYSIAMTAAEAFNTLTPPVRILATDIDTLVLEAAMRGVYSLDRLERVSEERRRRYFLRGTGANAGMAMVKQELRELVTFRQINLLQDSWPLRGPLDAIFCRNVMIYFDKSTQSDILRRFAPLLREDGLLFAGHSENFQHAADLFRLRGKTVYERARKARMANVRTAGQ